MEELTWQDFHAISVFLQKLYAPIAPQEFFSHVLGLLPTVVGSDASLLSHFVYEGTKWSCYCAAVSCNDLDYMNVPTNPEYVTENPTIQHYIKTQTVEVLKISDFLSRNELRRKPALYDLFIGAMGLEDQMACVLAKPGELLADFNTGLMQDMLMPSNITFSWNAAPEPKAGVNAGLALLVHRDKRNFLERDRAVLNLLRSHFWQAYQNSQLFGRMSQNADPVNQQPSQISLSMEGDIRWCDEGASQLLHKYFPQTVSNAKQLPELLQSWVKTQIANLGSAEPCPLQAFQVRRQENWLDIRILVDTPANQYILMLEEQVGIDISVQTLEALGLTHREAEVMFLSIRNQTNRQISEQLGMTLRTVQKHNENIYRKLGTDNRTAAVLKILNELGVTKI
jgi:DNA-binding CsgD family transcriptional regulator